MDATTKKWMLILQVSILVFLNYDNVIFGTEKILLFDYTLSFCVCTARVQFKYLCYNMCGIGKHLTSISKLLSQENLNLILHVRIPNGEFYPFKEVKNFASHVHVPTLHYNMPIVLQLTKPVTN